MIWLNDQISPKPRVCLIAGEPFAFFGVMPSVVVDPETAILTPTQRRILDHLEANADRRVSGFELRDAVMPERDEIGVRVQIHRMRAQGIVIDSVPGVGGGYRLAEGGR